MLILSFLPILLGAGLASQTAVNAKLRTYVQSPFIASAISFSVGAIFLIALELLNGGALFVSQSFITSNPWWIWLGGLLGVIGLTTNILLFPKLGGVKTAILPIMGQILMGLIIDQFGLFGSSQSSMTTLKLFGSLLLVVGVIIAVGGGSKKTDKEQSNLLLEVLGVLAGMLVASQSAINARLGSALGSSIQAAMYSFSIGALLLILLLVILRLSPRMMSSLFKLPPSSWWIWLGGFLGALYVFGTAWLVPQIGTGQMVVFALFGQLVFSAVIDHFALFEASKVKVSQRKLLGLALMLIGILIIRFIA